MTPELLILAQICTKSFAGWGFAPDPTGGAYSAPRDLLAGLRGLLLRGGEGRQGKGRGAVLLLRGGEGRRGRGKEGERGRGRGKGGRGRSDQYQTRCYGSVYSLILMTVCAVSDLSITTYTEKSFTGSHSPLACPRSTSCFIEQIIHNTYS